MGQVETMRVASSLQTGQISLLIVEVTSLHISFWVKMKNTKEEAFPAHHLLVPVSADCEDCYRNVAV